MVIIAMNHTEGAAWRIQLDAMLAVLGTFDEEAAECDDHDVKALVARLHEARSAAMSIETRHQPSTVPPPRNPAYRGVKLAKS